MTTIPAANWEPTIFSRSHLGETMFVTFISKLELPQVALNGFTGEANEHSQDPGWVGKLSLTPFPVFFSVSPMRLSNLDHQSTHIPIFHSHYFLNLIPNYSPSSNFFTFDWRQYRNFVFLKCAGQHRTERVLQAKLCCARMTRKSA